MPRYLLCLLIVAIVSITGCQQQRGNQSQVFAKTAIDMTLELEESGAQWGKSVRPWMEGGTIDVELAQRATQTLKEFVSQKQIEFDRLAVPKGQACEDFAETVRGYLEFELTMTSDLDELVQLAADNNPASLEIREQWYDKLLALNEKELVWKSRLEVGAKSLGLRIVENTEAD